MRRHRCPRDEPCTACEQAAERRAEARHDVYVEPLDAHGRTADWNYPRGYGGLT